MNKINFNGAFENFNHPNARNVRTWIKKVILNEAKIVGQIDYIFCSDEYLYELNKTFLNHNTYTDIITFDLSEAPDEISGEIYISIPRVKENASKFKSTFINELNRVIVHGVLHLIGFDDKTPRQKQVMRKKEEACLSLLK